MEINSGVHLYLKVKSAKCLCLLPVVLVLLIWSWSCKQRSCSWSWSCHFGLGLLGLVYITVQIRKIFILTEHLQWAGAYCGCTACYVRFSFFCTEIKQDNTFLHTDCILRGSEIHYMTSYLLPVLFFFQYVVNDARYFSKHPEGTREIKSNRLNLFISRT